MNFDTAWQASLSELAINISAAWFGAAFISPTLTHPWVPLDTILLIIDVILGIFFLVASVQLKRS